MRMARRIVFALVVLAMGALVPSALATTATNAGANFQAGSCLDQRDTNCGGWDHTTPLVAGRPYIKSLTITNGGVPTTVISNTLNVTNPDTTSNTYNIYAVVSPTNACSPTQTAGINCYASPNRATVSLVREVSAGNWTYDFTGATTTPAVTEDSTIDIVVGFRSTYSTLGWTWANGVPSGWNSTVTPLLGGDVELKFTPKSSPNTDGMPNTCTTVPVSSCSYTPTHAEVLSPQIIFSMDSTNAAFAGTLFATTASALGAIEIPDNIASNPSMTYQLAGPHTLFDGTDRIGALYAVLPDSILSLFGTSVSNFNSELLPVERTGDPGSGTVAWSTWSAGSGNLSSAQLLSVTGITFSAPKFVVGRQNSSSSNSSNDNSSSNSGRGGNSNRVKLGSTTSLATLGKALGLRTAGGATLSAKTSTPKVCRATKGGIKAIAVGTCKGTITVKPKKGKSSKKNFTLVVTKTGKRLPVALHR